MKRFEQHPEDLEYLPIEQLELWEKANVRKSNTLQNLEDLVLNIQKIGIRVPLLVKEELPKKKYLVFSGQRRLEAARKAKLVTVPCLVFKNITESEARIMSLSENIYREPMTAEDISDAAHILIRELGSTKDTAKKLGVPESHVIKYLGYRHVPEKLKNLVRERKMTAVQAVEIYEKFPNESKAVQVANEYSKLTRPKKSKFYKSIKLSTPSDDVERIHQRAKRIEVEKMYKFDDIMFPEKDSLLIKDLALRRSMNPKELIVLIVQQWLEEYGRGARKLD